MEMNFLRRFSLLVEAKSLGRYGAVVVVGGDGGCGCERVGRVGRASGCGWPGAAPLIFLFVAPRRCGCMLG